MRHRFSEPTFVRGPAMQRRQQRLGDKRRRHCGQVWRTAPVAVQKCAHHQVLHLRQQKRWLDTGCATFGSVYACMLFRCAALRQSRSRERISTGRLRLLRFEKCT